MSFQFTATIYLIFYIFSCCIANKNSDYRNFIGVSIQGRDGSRKDDAIYCCMKTYQFFYYDLIQ